MNKNKITFEENKKLENFLDNIELDKIKPLAKELRHKVSCYGRPCYDPSVFEERVENNFLVENNFPSKTFL